MASTVEQMRSWTGPAIFSFGFRPFFLGASVWAAVAMALWVAMLAGGLSLPTAFDPVSWHAHAFLFGFLGAVVAGFLLTAVPNWTGRLPIVGWPLAGIFALWAAGRVAVACSALLSPVVVVAVDLAFPIVLAAAIGREIIAGKNWKNLIVLALLAVLTVGNLVSHIEAATGAYAARGVGLRLGVAAGILMIALIGGRIVPSFTRNWLVKRQSETLPVPPMQTFDKVALVALLAGLLAWIATPDSRWTAILLLGVGGLHLVRLIRWAGRRTLAEPLVMVLHVGYLFVPLGAVAVGLEGLFPGVMGPAAQHLWMGGAIGLMTLAVMTRATLGHTGQALSAGPVTAALYLALATSVAARLLAGLWPGQASWLLTLSGGLWIAAFAGFSLAYGPLLLRARPAKSL